MHPIPPLIILHFISVKENGIFTYLNQYIMMSDYRYEQSLFFSLAK